MLTRLLAVGQSCPESNVHKVDVVSDPVVSMLTSNTSVCTGGELVLETAFQFGSGDCQLQWHYSDNGTVWQVIPGAQQLTYATGPLTATRYYKTTLYCDGIGCNTDTSAVITVTVLPTPALQITASDGVCAGQPVGLTASATGGLGGFSYQWQRLTPQGIFEDFAGASSTHFFVPALMTTTTYRVVLVGQGSACLAQADKTIVAFEQPNAWLAHDGPSCVGGTVNLQAGGGDAYSWTGPNGFVGSGNTLIFNNISLLQAGVYSVTATSGAGCSATATINISVSNCFEICDNGFDDDNDGLIDCIDLDCAVGDFMIQPDGATAVCFPQQVQLTVPGLYPVLWSNGSMQTTITVSSSGTYIVTATNTNGCARIDSVQVVIHPAVNLAATLNSTSVCEGASLSGLASGADMIVWRGPAGFEWIGASFEIPQANVISTGTFSVTGSNAFGCSDQQLFTVDVLPSPKAVVAHGGELNCSNSTVTLQGWSSTPGVTYSWIRPDGTTALQQNLVVALEGIYTLHVTDPLQGCFASDTALVERDEYQMPITASSLQTITCVETSTFVSIQGEHDNLSVTWTGSNGFFATGRLVEVFEAGTYSAQVTNLVNGCVTPVSVVVQANIQKPTVWATADMLNCDAPLSQLQAGSGSTQVQYYWTGPDGFYSNLQNPQVGRVGTYTVFVKDLTNGCESESYSVEVVAQ